MITEIQVPDYCYSCGGSGEGCPDCEGGVVMVTVYEVAGQRFATREQAEEFLAAQIAHAKESEGMPWS